MNTLIHQQFSLHIFPTIVVSHSGQIELKRYRNGKIQFDSNGVLIERSFSWIEKGPEQWRNLDNILDVEFYPDGNIRKIELVRDEPTRDGVGLGDRYSWHWNDKMNLIEFPKSLKEPFPWTRFPELRLNPQMVIGLKKHLPRMAFIPFYFIR